VGCAVVFFVVGVFLIVVAHSGRNQPLRLFPMGRPADSLNALVHDSLNSTTRQR
jgi:hypothetical protein